MKNGPKQQTCLSWSRNITQGWRATGINIVSRCQLLNCFWRVATSNPEACQLWVKEGSFLVPQIIGEKQRVGEQGKWFFFCEILPNHSRIFPVLIWAGKFCMAHAFSCIHLNCQLQSASTKKNLQMNLMLPNPSMLKQFFFKN